MKKENLAWSDLGIFICSKCLNENGLPAENLKSYLKTELNNKGYKGKVRVMTTSCLGICPENSQAVSYLQTNKNNPSGAWICQPDEDKEKILSEIIAKIETKS